KPFPDHPATAHRLPLIRSPRIGVRRLPQSPKKESVMVRQVTCAAVVALLVGSTAFVAADDKKNKPLDAGTFVAKAASAGMFEIKSSQLAQERSQKDAVKRF